MSDLSIAALRGIREQFEASTPAAEWPQAAAGEMMLLGDVCAALGASEEQTAEVLGPAAWDYVTALMDGPQ